MDSSSLILIEGGWKQRFWFSRTGHSQKLIHLKLHRNFPFTKANLLRVVKPPLPCILYYQEVIGLGLFWSVTFSDTLSTYFLQLLLQTKHLVIYMNSTDHTDGDHLVSLDDTTDLKIKKWYHKMVLISSKFFFMSTERCSFKHC